MSDIERDQELESRIEALETRIEPLERAVVKLLATQIEAERARSALAAEPTAQTRAREIEPAEAREMEAAAARTRAEAFAKARAEEAARAAARFAVPRPLPSPGAPEPAAAATRPPAAAAPLPAEREAAPAAIVAPEPAFDLRAMLADLEERMTGRALVWVGGVALLLAAVLFLGLAFSQGWIGNEARVAMGLVGGAIGLVVGAVFMERGNRLLGHVLTPVGLAVISISLVAATRLYDLIPVPLGLGLALVAAVATAVIAVRSDSQVVAAFGLIAVLMAPPLLGAAPDMTTLAFVGVTLIGTTAISLWRTWAWLPPLAFVLSAPQAASWLLGESNVAFGLAGLAAFSVLQAVAAGGEEFRRRRDDLSASSATLLIASAAFLVWGGFVLLAGDLAAYRATFLVVVALAYLGLGAFFIVRDGDRHLFGLLTMATGIAALTMAAPIGLGAPAVPVAWTAEAVVLAWVALRRPHPYSALVSGGLYVLTACWLVYNVFLPGTLPDVTVPFTHPGGVALATFLLGVAAGVAIVPIESARRALAGLGLATAAWCAFVELSGPSVVGAEIGLAVVGAALIVGLPRLRTRAIDWRPDGLIARIWPTVESLGPATSPLIPLVATVAGAVATGHLLVYELVLDWAPAPSGIPFIGVTGLAVAVYLAGLLAVGVLIRSWALRQALSALGLLVMVAACLAELSGPPVVAAEIALVVLASAARAVLPALRRSAIEPGGRSVPAPLATNARHLLPAAMFMAGALATAHLLVYELGFDWMAPASGVPFVGVSGLTLAAYLLGLLAVGWLERSWPLRQALAALGLLVTAAACSRELPGDVAIVAAWAAMAVLGLALWRALAALAARDGMGTAFQPVLSLGPGAVSWSRLLVGNTLRVAALLVAGLAVARTLLVGLPLDELTVGTLPAVPFTDAGAAMGAILAAAAVLGGLVTGGAFARRAGILLAGVAIAYTIPFQVEPWAVAVLWSGLAVAAFVAARLDTGGTVPYLLAGAAVLALAAVDAIAIVAPPSRLVVSADGLSQAAALGTLAALASVCGAVAVAIALFRSAPWVRWAEIAAGLLVVYLFSIGVVDAFATQIGGATSLEELRWQSQAVLSVTWALMGMIAFVAGLRLGRAELRVGGLILLGVTTAKVFVIDLAALDLAYKVMALFGLGLVLLVSGGLWQRLHTRPPRTPHGPAAVHP